MLLNLIKSYCWPARKPAQPGIVPRVAIIDDWSKLHVDVDGDRVPDISHGQAMESIFREQLRHVDLVRFPVEDDQIATLTGQINKLIRRIKKREHFDAVNISLSIDIKELFTHLKGFRLSDIEKLIGCMTEKENVTIARDLILKKLKKLYYRGYATIQSLEKLSKLGVPVFIGAGNEPSRFNAFLLAQGSIGVSGCTPKGIKIPKFPNHPLVNSWFQAILSVRKMKDGFSLTGNGKTSIGFDQVSGNETYVAYASGRPLKALVADEDDLNTLSTIPHNKCSVFSNADINWQMLAEKKRLFPLEALKRFFEPEIYATLKMQGDYAFLSSSRSQVVYGGFIFRVNQHNQVYYSPVEASSQDASPGETYPGGIFSGNTDAQENNIVNSLCGTSLATPMAIINMLQKKYNLE